MECKKRKKGGVVVACCWVVHTYGKHLSVQEDPGRNRQQPQPFQEEEEGGGWQRVHTSESLQFNSINPCRHFIRVLPEYPFYSLQRRLINALSGRWWHGHTLYTIYIYMRAANKGAYVYAHIIFEWRRGGPILRVAHSFRAVKNLRSQSSGRARLLVSIKISMMRTSGRPATPESLVIQGNKGLQPHVRWVEMLYTLEMTHVFTIVQQRRRRKRRSCSPTEVSGKYLYENSSYSY